ncbi:Uncharacterised protein [Bordetella pertussis]|nr:Uncharacterised protein [Bordetella pertussis]
MLAASTLISSRSLFFSLPRARKASMNGASSEPAV